MRLTALAEDREQAYRSTLPEAIDEYDSRDARRVARWNAKFSLPRPPIAEVPLAQS